MFPTIRMRDVFHSTFVIQPFRKSNMCQPTIHPESIEKSGTSTSCTLVISSHVFHSKLVDYRRVWRIWQILPAEDAGDFVLLVIFWEVVRPFRGLKPHCPEKCEIGIHSPKNGAINIHVNGISHEILTPSPYFFWVFFLSKRLSF